MRKVFILLFITVFLSGCSYKLKVENLGDIINPNKDLRFRIGQLANSLDHSLKFLKTKQEKIVVVDFKPMSDESKLLGKYIKEKLKEELFKLGYLISTEGKASVKVSGVYVDTGKKLEIIASIEGEGIKLSEASVTVSKKYLLNTPYFTGGKEFLSSER